MGGHGHNHVGRERENTLVFGILWDAPAVQRVTALIALTAPEEFRKVFGVCERTNAGLGHAGITSPDGDG